LRIRRWIHFPGGGGHARPTRHKRFALVSYGTAPHSLSHTDERCVFVIFPGRCGLSDTLFTWTFIVARCFRLVTK
jgi:hypothetical protein